MKKTILLMIFVSILLSSFGSAVCVSCDNSLIDVYNWEQNPDSSDLIDQVGSLDSSADDVRGTVSGVNGLGWDFERGNTDFVTMPVGIMDGHNNYSISCWVQFESLRTEAQNDYIYHSVDEGANPNYILISDSGGTLKGSQTRGTDPAESVTLIQKAGAGGSGFYNFITVYNATGTTWYVNGTFGGRVLSTSFPIDSDTEFQFGSLAGNPVGGNLDGIMDECYIWNKSLNTAEIADLQTTFYPFVALTKPTTPTIVAPSPANNANNNTNVTLNVTHDTQNNDVRYYLYFGDTLTLNETDLYIINETRDGDEHKSFLTNVTDGTYFWKWKIQNITNGLFSSNTSQRTLIINTVTPTITILGGTNFSIDNNTIFNNYLTNFSINISFLDEHLAGGQVLINITNSTDNSIFFRLNTSITGTTANYSELIDISTLSLGNYTVKLIATDSHTLSEINNYDIVTGLSYFRYTTKEGNIIKITSNTLPLTKNTNKLKDRYDFEFNYLFQKDTYTFTIESYNKINYIEDSEYKAHFVIMGNNVGGNWIDFENPNLNKKDYKVTKINDYIYEIEVTANGIKNFKFSSIGGLNKKEEHYKFQIGAVLDIRVGDDATGNPINATATIGSQSASSISNVSPARLVNITTDITFVTLNSTGFGTEQKSISITQSFHNLSFNMTVSSATRISFFDENSEELIIGETFSVFLEKTGFSNTFSGITDNPHTITGLDEGIYKLKASSSNYQEREYRGLNISNTTTTLINVYLINNTLSQQVTFTVQGSGGNKLDNADIDFLRVINGTETIIAQENTDFAGQAKLFLDPNYEYGINLIRSGYISRNITLEPTDTEYTIILLTGEAGYQSVYEGVRFRFYHNGIMTVSPPDILNLTNSTQNITFEVEGTDIAEIGINFTNHGYACTPASCSATLANQGQVTLGILLNESGTFNTAYYFQKTGEKKIYVNDGLIKVIPFIFASLDGLPQWVIEMKGELSPNLRTLLVAMLNVIAVGVGASLGLAGSALIIPVLGVTIIASLPEIGLIHPFIGMIIAIFGVVIYVYSQTR